MSKRRPRCACEIDQQSIGTCEGAVGSKRRSYRFALAEEPASPRRREAPECAISQVMRDFLENGGLACIHPPASQFPLKSQSFSRSRR